MNVVLLVEKVIVHHLVRDYRRRTFNQVLLPAYEAFIGHHPQWEASLFDEHFLSQQAATLLKAYLEETMPNAKALAEAWAAQWGWGPKSKYVAELTPIAANFLSCLETELRSRWVTTELTPVSSTTGLANT